MKSRFSPGAPAHVEDAQPAAQAQPAAKLSKLEAFIIERIRALRVLGWSTNRIADAIGVDADFVESALNAR